MSFLDKNGLQVLTTKLVQGDAIKVASHRGHTVKNVIDNITRECENISTPNTMNLENRVDKFKVGKGRDVDVSGDVEEGKVEVKLEGKTWQNLVKENQIYVKELKTTNHTGFLLPKYDLKSNTIYTIMFTVSNLVKDGNSKVYSIFRGNNNDNSFIQFDALYVEKNGLFAQKFTLANGLKNFLIGISGSSNKNNPSFTIGDIMILEGDHTQTPIEELPKYFEGIKSSFEDGVVDFEVVGKNLIEKNSFETGNGLLDITNVIKTGETYSLSYKIDSMSSDTPYIRLRFQGRNKDGSTDYFGEVFAHEYIGKRVFPKPLKFNKQYEKIELLLQVFNHGATCSVSDVQLEMSTVATSYEPYYKKKISFNIGEPLRSLPNGVCDEIRNNNGQWELIRKIGKVVLNGSEGWNLGSGSSGWNVNGNTLPFYAYLIDDKKVNGHSLTDLFTTSTGSIIVGIDEESFSLGHINYITIRLKRDKLLTEDANGFKKWLSQNPTTVYYELKTPIITPIEPMEFDVKPLATMTINSDIAPVSNHKVVLNRAGQIEQGIIQIAELKSRVDALETAYDSYLLETQHKLSLLGFEYELESEEI